MASMHEKDPIHEELWPEPDALPLDKIMDELDAHEVYDISAEKFGEAYWGPEFTEDLVFYEYVLGAYEEWMSPIMNIAHRLLTAGGSIDRLLPLLDNVRSQEERDEVTLALRYWSDHLKGIQGELPLRYEDIERCRDYLRRVGGKPFFGDAIEHDKDMDWCIIRAQEEFHPRALRRPETFQELSSAIATPKTPTSVS